MRAANVSSIFRDDFALAKGDGGKAKKPASAEYMRTVLLKPRLMKAALELLRASAGASEATDDALLDAWLATDKWRTCRGWECGDQEILSAVLEACGWRAPSDLGTPSEPAHMLAMTGNAGTWLRCKAKSGFPAPALVLQKASSRRSKRPVWFAVRNCRVVSTSRERTGRQGGPPGDGLSQTPTSSHVRRPAPDRR